VAPAAGVERVFPQAKSDLMPARRGLSGHNLPELSHTSINLETSMAAMA